MEDKDLENKSIISDEEVVTFKNLLQMCMTSYAEKDAATTDEEWLETLFKQEIRNITEEKAGADAEVIVKTVGAIIDNLRKIDASEKQGISKERWFSDQIQIKDDAAGRNEQGKLLQSMGEILYDKNMELADGDYAESSEIVYDMYESSEETEQEYSPYQIKELAMDIGKNASVMGIQTASSTIGTAIAARIMEGEQIIPSEIIQEALQSGVDSSLQIVASGALEIASQNELIQALPQDTSAEVIASISSMGIENVKILSRILSGEISLMQGITQFGRVTTAVIGNIFNMAKGGGFSQYITKVFPFLGPKAVVIAEMIGTTVAFLGGTPFGKKIVETKNKVANAAKAVANAAVQGLRKVGRAIKQGANKVKNAIKELFS